MAKGMTLEDVHVPNEWTPSRKNPDYNLILVQAANAGYTARAGDTGSYFTSLFVEKLMGDIEDGRERRIADIFQEIQNQLHSERRQLPVNQYNNNTMNLIIRKNEEMTE